MIWSLRVVNPGRHLRRVPALPDLLGREGRVQLQVALLRVHAVEQPLLLQSREVHVVRDGHVVAGLALEVDRLDDHVRDLLHLQLALGGSLRGVTCRCLHYFRCALRHSRLHMFLWLRLHLLFLVFGRLKRLLCSPRYGRLRKRNVFALTHLSALAHHAHCAMQSLHVLHILHGRVGVVFELLQVELVVQHRREPVREHRVHAVVHGEQLALEQLLLQLLVLLQLLHGRHLCCSRVAAGIGRRR